MFPTLIEKISIVKELGFEKYDWKAWYTKYRTHKRTAAARKIRSELSFYDYLLKAKQAGIEKPECIGPHTKNFCLGRYGDTGNYTVDNCRFITVEQNVLEKIINGGAQIAGNKNAIHLRGRTAQTHSYIAKRLIKMQGRTKENDPSIDRRAQLMKGRTKETHAGIAAQSIAMTGRTKENHPGIAIGASKRTGQTKETNQNLAIGAEKRSKSFVVLDPNGVRYYGRNLHEFCKQRNFDTTRMASVFTGTRVHYKGWVGQYLDEDVSEILDPSQHYVYTQGLFQKPNFGACVIIVFTEGKEDVFIAEPHFNVGITEMGLLAIYKALSYFKESRRITIYSTDRYAVNAVIRWSAIWREYGWKNTHNEFVKNYLLLEEIYQLMQFHIVTLRLLLDYDGNSDGIRCVRTASHLLKNMIIR